MFSSKLYQECLETHLDLDKDDIKYGVSLFKKLYPSAAADILIHLSKNTDVGKLSWTYNKKVDAYIKNRLSEIPTDLWPEINSPELTNDEVKDLLELRQLELLAMKNTLSEGRLLDLNLTNFMSDIYTKCKLNLLAEHEKQIESIPTFIMVPLNGISGKFLHYQDAQIFNFDDFLAKMGKLEIIENKYKKEIKMWNSCL